MLCLFLGTKMLTFVLKVLKALPANFWYILGCFLGVSSITTPIALAYLVANSGSIIYKAGNTEINLKGKEINNSVDELLLRLQALESANNELLAAAKNKIPQGDNEGLSAQIEKVEGAIAQSTSIAEDLSDKQTELNTLLQ